MKEAKQETVRTINMMPESQRDQWHVVVNLLRQLGGDMDYTGRSALCDEIDRYIDHVENILDDLRKDGANNG